MAVYVDEPVWPFGRMTMCHLMADTLEELHAMAMRIGIERRWFQNAPGTVPPHKIPHYDVCKSKRALAVARGAQEVDRKRTVEIMNMWRARNAEATAARKLEGKKRGKVKHPLRWMLLLHAIPATPKEESALMDVLQDRGLISDLCQTIEEIAPADVARVLAAHRARWSSRP